MFVATKKGRTTNFFLPSSFVAVVGSAGWIKIRIRGINIPYPQHCS
jgi:hypothetical protein